AGISLHSGCWCCHEYSTRAMQAKCFTAVANCASLSIPSMTEPNCTARCACRMEYCCSGRGCGPQEPPDGNSVASTGGKYDTCHEFATGADGSPRPQPGICSRPKLG